MKNNIGKAFLLVLAMALLVAPAYAAIVNGYQPGLSGNYTWVSSTSAHGQESFNDLSINGTGWDAGEEEIIIFVDRVQAVLTDNGAGQVVSNKAVTQGAAFGVNVTVPACVPHTTATTIILDGNVTAANQTLTWVCDPEVYTLTGYVKMGTAAKPGRGLEGMKVTIQETTYPYYTASNLTLTTNAAGAWTTTSAVINEGTTLISLASQGRIKGYGTSPSVTANGEYAYYVNETIPIGAPINVNTPGTTGTPLDSGQMNLLILGAIVLVGYLLLSGKVKL